MIVSVLVPLFQSLAYLEVGTHAIPEDLLKVEEAKSVSGHEVNTTKT